MELFAPAQNSLYGGAFHLSLRTVVEESNSRYVALEGNTRFLFCFNNDIKQVKAVVVRRVSHASGKPIPLKQVRITTIKHPPGERMIGYNNKLFRDIERAVVLFPWPLNANLCLTKRKAWDVDLGCPDAIGFREQTNCGLFAFEDKISGSLATEANPEPGRGSNSRQGRCRSHGLPITVLGSLMLSCFGEQRDFTRLLSEATFHQSHRDSLMRISRDQILAGTLTELVEIQPAGRYLSFSSTIELSGDERRQQLAMLDFHCPETIENDRLVSEVCKHLFNSGALIFSSGESYHALGLQFIGRIRISELPHKLAVFRAYCR